MKKVLITGGNGLCGSSLKRLSINYPQHEFIFITRDDGDLTVEEDVDYLYGHYRPNYIIHTAASVGGIGGNSAKHADFFYNNILMNTFMIKGAVDYEVEKFIGFSSVCVFPDDLAVLQEDKMHNGPVFESNFAYGYAKRMVDVYIRACKKQYGIKNYCSIIPGNIIGEADQYDINYGHVVPSLIHKIYLAKQNNTKVEVWGDGKSLREFLYVDDLSKVVLNLLEIDELPQRLIVSGPKQYSIKEIVDILVEVSELNPNQIYYNTNKPNGQRSRPTSLSLLYSIFPNFQFTDIKDAITNSYKWFEENYPNVRLNY